MVDQTLEVGASPLPAIAKAGFPKRFVMDVGVGRPEDRRQGGSAGMQFRVCMGRSVLVNTASRVRQSLRRLRPALIRLGAQKRKTAL